MNKSSLIYFFVKVTKFLINSQFVIMKLIGFIFEIYSKVILISKQKLLFLLKHEKLAKFNV